MFSLLLSTASLFAQNKWNAAFQAYIDQYKGVAIEEMLRYNIPASITLAQGLIESGAGQSKLAVYGNNHFGIKCHDWQGNKIYKDDDVRDECFRSYENPRESFEDHSKFLAQRPRYQKLFTLSRTDYKGWARGLKAAGYATDPHYPKKLIGIIELYNLHDFDTASGEVAPATGMPSMAITTPTEQPIAQHAFFLRNDNCYLKARRGDTFQSIAEEVLIPAHKLAEYNERNKNDVLSEGDIVYLRHKRNSAEVQFKGKLHIVKAGESMYSIAQFYGIKLESLYKMNKLTPDYDIAVGDGLRVFQ